MNKKILISLIALALVIAAMAGVYLTSRPETNRAGKTITVTVVHADGSEKAFEYTTEEEYLGPVILAEGLVEGAMEQYGLVISAVDGEAASWEENQSYWSIVDNGEYAVTGADGIALVDGGQYRLEYTIG